LLDATRRFSIQGFRVVRDIAVASADSPRVRDVSPPLGRLRTDVMTEW
jgi:hypothetical protein